jgi:DNA invertase Pin-like site-specific DNA recombinase
MDTTSQYMTKVESEGGDVAVRIAIYARLSRDPSGLSVNTSLQVAECLEEVKRYSRVRGVRAEIAVIFEENDIGASEFSKRRRPDFESLIVLIRENQVDVVFATEVERLARQPVDAERLINLAGTTDLREVHLTSEEGCDLSTPNGVHQLRKAVNLAERESRKTSERLRRKLAARARNGQPHGSRRCFGYKVGGMEIDNVEAGLLRKMGSKLLAGSSFKEIAYWANEQGYKTAEGKIWYPVTVRNSLRRVRYAGIREHRGELYQATWPAIFDSVTWEQMQLNTPLNGERKRDRPGRPIRPIYYCRVQGDTQRERGCGGVAINADALDWYIRESVFDHLDPQECIEFLRHENQDDNTLKQLFAHRAAQELRLTELVDDYASGLLNRTELSRAKEKAHAELSRINSEIELLANHKCQLGRLSAREELERAWEANEDTSWRRALIDIAVERIDIFPSIRKPFVNVDGVTMRFGKDRVKITWRKVDFVAV